MVSQVPRDYIVLPDLQKDLYEFGFLAEKLSYEKNDFDDFHYNVFSESYYTTEIKINLSIDVEKNSEYSLFKQSIFKYFKNAAVKNDNISITSNIMSSMPCIKDTRIPVSTILFNIRDVCDFKEISDAFSLSNGKILSALDYAIELLENIYYEEDEI